MSALIVAIPLLILFALSMTYMTSVTAAPSKQRPRRSAVYVDIHNVSSQTADLGDGVVLQPGASTKIVVPSESSIQAKSVNFDGSVTTKIMRTRPVANAPIYITEAMITTDAREGELINDSDMPVQFIQLGDSARRWPQQSIVPPNSRLHNIVIANGSQWQIVNPSEDSFIVATVTATEDRTKLRFDGTDLTATQT